MAKNIHKDRAGAYQKQPTDYLAFIPRSLPPTPPLRIDPAMLLLLSEADRALGRLDGAADTLPNPDLFVFMYVRKEAVLSSQIEGTQASLMDVLEFEADAAKPGNPQDVEEVVNYIGAMNYGLARLKELPLSLRLIREIHASLMQGVRGGNKDPGEFRRSQNWVGPAGSNLKRAIYVPPPPVQMLEALNNLEIFLHGGDPMPVLIKAGLAHSQFETIHPFLDGNGRMGRLLITFLLCQSTVLKRPLLYLSFYFKQHRKEYYDRLQSVREYGDWEGWLKFFLRGVTQVSEEATQTSRHIVSLREQHRELIRVRTRKGASTALALLEKLYFRPVVSVQRITELTGLTYANANNLAKDFVNIGLLKETTGAKRNRSFAYKPYLDLFKDVTPTV